MLHRDTENRNILEIVDAVRAAIGQYRPRVVVHGDIMLDEYLSGEVDRISPEAPIPIIAGNSYVYRLGGAANVAANLASLGSRVDLTGIVGDDEAAGRLEKLLARDSVDASHLITVHGRQTTRKLRVVAGSQQIVRIDFEDTAPPAKDFVAQQIATTKRLVKGADALIISDYNKGACSDSVLSELIEYARAMGVPVLSDPKGKSYGKYAGSSVITPNRKEASEAVGVPLANNDDIADAAMELRRSLELDACVVTLGAHGMFLSDQEGNRNIPAFSQDVADVTGAGDCVIAALGVGLACKLTNLSSCVFANAVASIAVSKVGSVAVTLDEVTRKYASASIYRSASKIVPVGLLEDKVRELKEAGKTIVFTNGCFDVFHAGHVDNLHQCAELGSAVIVGLNSDASVRMLKGPGRPVNSADDRAAILVALEAVDMVVIFDDDTPEHLIRIVRPDVLVKGADYTNKDVVGRDFVESYGGRVELVPFKKGVSTTTLLDKLKADGA